MPLRGAEGLDLKRQLRWKYSKKSFLPPSSLMQGQPMALQRLAAFLQDQHFQGASESQRSSGRARKPVVLISPADGEGNCLAVGYEATGRMQVGSGGRGVGGHPDSKLQEVLPTGASTRGQHARRSLCGGSLE